MNRVVLHIERLVLRGVDPSDATGVSEAIRTELERVCRAPGAAEGLSAIGDRHRIRAATVRTPSGADRTGLGTRIARSVGRSLETGEPR
jgi:hypothetical protein